MTTVGEPDAAVLASAWLDADPDPETRNQVQSMIDAGGAKLTAAFSSPLQFGTAGLRGQLGAGPGAMNCVLVRVVASAISQLIATQQPEGDSRVVIGYDARYKSRDFAEDTARVMARAGIAVTLLPRPLPTPVLAYAVRHLGAAAGVMVTASHNPRTDNGYKVYWRGGAQIVAPIDSDISDLISTTHLLHEADLAPLDHANIEVAAESLIESYLQATVSLLDPNSERSTKVAYTALHGVGTQTLVSAFDMAGFDAPFVVANQGAPDPEFPTTPFPNPEETGVLDGLFALATEIGADVAMANDPDADRLAVAVPHGRAWRLLTGDELGCLLAEHLLSRSDLGRRALVLNTIVSSRLLGQISTNHDARFAQTLTGFKWLMQARADICDGSDYEFVMAYEEALGYCIGGPVWDKDGVSAALALAEMVSSLKTSGRTLLDLLDDLHLRHGVHITGQRSVRFEQTAAATSVMDLAMDTLRRYPPESVAGMTVTGVFDFANERNALPPTNAIAVELEGARLVVRPSGTEPKMKVYGEAWSLPGVVLSEARLDTRRRLNLLLSDLVLRVADPERTVVIADSTSTADVEVAERALRLFETTAVGRARVEDLRLIVRCIDLTTLEGDDTPGRVRALCAKARRPDPGDPTVGPVAAVCVYPVLAPLAVELMSGTVRVASVAGAFPSGLSAPAVRVSDIVDAAEAGVDEIDIVLNRSALLSGRVSEVRADIEAARAAVPAIHLKVIIEVGDLVNDTLVRRAAQLAIEAGADTIKTSTGKSGSSATPASVLAMAEVIKRHHEQTGEAVGLKVSGGVRTPAEALGYVAIVREVLGVDWLTPDRFRFGASSLLDAVVLAIPSTEVE